MSLHSNFILQNPNPPMPAILEGPMRTPLRYDIRDQLILQTKLNDATVANDRRASDYKEIHYYAPNGREVPARNPVGAIPFLREQPLHPEIATDLYCEEIRNPDNSIYKSAYSCGAPNTDTLKRLSLVGLEQHVKDASKFEQFWV